jgi:hypothetical protein
MPQRRYVVGTSPVLIANDNKARASISITMLPTAVESGNTGRVHVGKGFIPTATLGAPNQGDILLQGTTISDVPQFEGDPSLFKGQWWAIADTPNQILTVDETFE